MTLADWILWLWQLPQHLAALALRYLVAWDETGFRGGVRVYVSDRMPGSVSLGQYVFLRRPSDLTERHECGHSRQSLYLGPLYLVVVGLPSLCWHLICRVCRPRDYYSFPTELWANRLAGIKTEDMA